MECVVDGCTKKRRSDRRLCSMHAARKARYGSTDPRKGSEGPLKERYERLAVRADGCWGWAGHANASGYGKLGRLYAHRIAYELYIGPIAKGMQVCHRCDNPPCSNPDHLFLGTAADNAADAKRKGRTARGERSPHAKITSADAVTIRATYESGKTQRVIAQQFGISQTMVSAIVRGKIWV